MARDLLSRRRARVPPRHETGLIISAWAPRTLREALPGRGALRWYLGSTVSLLWLLNIGVDVYGSDPRPESRAWFTVLMALYALGFLLAPPISWVLPKRITLLPPLGLWALSLALLPWLGAGVYSLWVFVGVVVAMSFIPFRAALVWIAVLTIATVVTASLSGLDAEGVFSYTLILASVSLMMAAFARMIVNMNQLRATQHELARLAVEQERTRVARDMHDILGHSLTVITVKAELAGRLVETDPEGAAREIAEVEELARGALADVRSTVSGYRGVSIAAELGNARVALEAAGIEATLPGSVDAIPAERRELFGWVLREGVTNVVRHSGATHCAVKLGADFIEVLDDGAPEAAHTDGTGLTGLRERVTAAGLTMSAGRTDDGFRLLVSS